MFNLKLSKIKLIPVFAVIFCLAITSCTEEEIVPQVMEQSTEILDLKTTAADGEIVERGVCNGLRDGVITRLQNLKSVLENYSSNTNYGRPNVQTYFNDYVYLLNYCVPVANYEYINLYNNTYPDNSCNFPFALDPDGEPILTDCNNGSTAADGAASKAFEHFKCSIGNYVEITNSSKANKVENAWEALIASLNKCVTPQQPISIDLNLN